MTNELRAMCAELANAYEHELNKRGMGCDLINRARALLAQPVEEGPTDEELLRIAAEAFGYLFLDGGIGGGEGEFLAFARAALARWGRLTPQPVAVSERLPGPKDCEAGECWAWDVAAESWNRTHYALCNHFTHWLPANALPTPETNV